MFQKMKVRQLVIIPDLPSGSMNSLSAPAPPVARIDPCSDPPDRADRSPRLVIPDRTEPGIPDFFDAATRTVMERFHEQCRIEGVPLYPEELIEWGLFESFLSAHVAPDSRREIPCMFLWAEWVRFSFPRMRTFPSLIREKEFRTLLREIFGTEIAMDDQRGLTFPGIRYISNGRSA